MSNSLYNALSSHEQGLINTFRDHIEEHIWQINRYRHPTNYSARLSDDFVVEIAKLTELLVADHLLKDAERFLLISAAYFFHIGMQSPYTWEVINLNLPDPHEITPLQMEQMAKHRGSLTADMVIRDARILGIDNPLWPSVIADVCHIEDSEAIDQLEELALFGRQVDQVNQRKVARLLVAADALFMSPNRINLETLSSRGASMSISYRAGLWSARCVQGVTINPTNGLVSPVFLIPEQQKELTEPIVKMVLTICSQACRLLLGLANVSVTERPRIIYAPVEPHEQIPREIADFLLSEMTEPPTEMSTLFVDYEGIQVFLGRHGIYTLSGEDVIRSCLAGARRINKAYIYADWERFPRDYAQISQMTGATSIECKLPRNDRQDIVQAIAYDASLITEQGRKQNFTIVCTRSGLEETVRRLSDYGSVTVWTPGGETERAYRGITQQFGLLENQLALTITTPLAEQIVRTRQFLIAVIVDKELNLRKISIVQFSQVVDLLRQHAIFHESRWWVNFAFHSGLLRRAKDQPGGDILCELDKMSLIVQDAFELRSKLLQTLVLLVEQNPVVTELQLHTALKAFSDFSSDLVRAEWLQVLRQAGIICSDDSSGGLVICPHIEIPNLRYVIELIVNMSDEFARIFYVERKDFTFLRPLPLRDNLQKRGASRDIAQATLDVAKEEGLIRFEQKQGRDQNRPYSVVYLVRDNPRVQQYLDIRNRIIATTHDFVRTRKQITREKLDELLEPILDGSLAMRVAWIQIMVDEGILKASSEPDTTPMLYMLDDEHPVVLNVISPLYINLLLYQICHFRHPKFDKYGVKLAKDNLTRQWTHSESITKEVFDLATDNRRNLRHDNVRMAQLQTGPHPTIEGRNLTVIEMSPKQRHAWDTMVESHLTNLKHRLMNLVLEPQLTNDFSYRALLRLLAQDEAFGMVDAERTFWINVLSDHNILRKVHDRYMVNI